MTLPAILSRDWTNPLSFATKFSVCLAIFLSSSIALLSSWEASQSQSLPKGGLKAAAAPLKPRVPPGGIIEGLKEISGNARLRRIMASIFIGQVPKPFLSSSFTPLCPCTLK